MRKRESITWWRHQMETFSALLALCAGNSPVTGEFPTQGPVSRSFDVFFDLRLNKWLSKQSWGWWFETPSSSLWRHCNNTNLLTPYIIHISRPDMLLELVSMSASGLIQPIVASRKMGIWHSKLIFIEVHYLWNFCSIVALEKKCVLCE